MDDSKDKLFLAVCSYIIPEFTEIITKDKYPDVVLQPYHSSCGRKDDREILFEKLLEKEHKGDWVILASSCSHFSSAFKQKYQPNLIALDQCFDPFLNKALIHHYISNGYYITTNGWLRKLEQHKVNWGFKNKDIARSFFMESMKKILFLNTGLTGDYLTKLEDLSDYMGLPYEVLPVGLDHCKQFVNSIVLEWRYEKERQILNKKISGVSKKSSDLMVIFNQLEILVNLTDEKKIIDLAFNLMSILFAPKGMRYSRFIDGNLESFEKGECDAEPDTKSKKGFRIEIASGLEIFGVVGICTVQFPQFLDQYKEMGKTISQILAISISNARKYDQVLQQKRQIEEVSRELVRSNTTKDKFFSIVAHDLKAPFNTMLGFSEFLIEDIENGQYENIKRSATIINQNLSDTLTLLNNLLNWSRAQLDEMTFEPKELLLTELMLDIKKQTSTQADNKNVFLKFKIGKEDKVYADENMLKLIIRNLVSNAIKYSHKNGIVQIHSYCDSDKAKISVADQGIGMAKSVADNLFSLEKTKSEKGTAGEKGTGLGLILCREFVGAHKGHITVDSEFGRGTVFSVTLPNIKS